MRLLPIVIVAMSVFRCYNDDGSGWIMQIVSDANVEIIAEFCFHFELLFHCINFSELFRFVYSFVHSFELRIRLMIYFRMQLIETVFKREFLFQMNFYQMLIFRSIVLQFSSLLLPKLHLVIFFSVCL